MKSVEQAGSNRNCCDYVLSLTTYIKDGFEKRGFNDGITLSCEGGRLLVKEICNSEI